MLINRKVANQPISKSFKGLLRISNILELLDGKKDSFLEPYYYGKPSQLLDINNTSSANISTYDSAYIALAGLTRRYTFTDPYKDKKVPITDSVGNYYNINIGVDGVTIGSDETINGNSLDNKLFESITGDMVSQREIFPVLTTNQTLKVGIEENKDKYPTFGTIRLDKSLNIQPMIIFNNKFNNSPENINNNNFLTIDNDRYRTIFNFTNENVKVFDILMYNQENYDRKNYKSSDKIDSNVDIFNLNAYIKDKINSFIKDNITEVPTGSVIWQYISLDKWYGKGLSDSLISHNPPMDKDLNNENLYQGVCKKRNNIYNQGNKLFELIPLYKRDYALCDGSSYYIAPSINSSNDIDFKSYDMFMNLFLSLRYNYTNKDIIKLFYCKQYTLPTMEIVNSTIMNHELFREIAFGLDFISLITIKLLYEELSFGKSNNGHSACLNNDLVFSKTLALEWLKKQKIPNEFIFNTPIHDEIDNNKKHIRGYTVNFKGKNINIGREVNSFNSYIRTEIYDPLHTVVCRVWELYEVKKIINIFSKPPEVRSSELKKFFTVTFQVPNFMSNHLSNKIGLFVGSSGYYYDMSSNKRYEEGINIKMKCFISADSIPHRHFIFNGSPYINKDQNTWQWQTGTDPDKIPSSDAIFAYMDSETPSRGGSHIRESNNNYVFSEINKTDTLNYQNKVNNGILCKTLQMNDTMGSQNWEIFGNGIVTGDYRDPSKNSEFNKTTNYGIEHYLDPRFDTAEPNRGITSQASDIIFAHPEKYNYAKYINNNSGEFFSPESSQMIPLIKI